MFLFYSSTRPCLIPSFHEGVKKKTTNWCICRKHCFVKYHFMSSTSFKNIMYIQCKLCIYSQSVRVFLGGGPYIETSPLICSKSVDWFLYDRDLNQERVKCCVHYIFADLFRQSKRDHVCTRKNVFYFSSKALFVLEKVKNFRYSDFMTSSNA